MPRSLLVHSRVAAPGTRAGWSLFARGFRPFFLLATAYLVLALPAWLWWLHGGGGPGYLGAYHWHAHEMLFGYAGAVLAGFLLTAASNWTGRDTATGIALAALAALWLLGRLAILLGDALPPGLAALVDLAFLPAVAVAVGVPLVAARSFRNFGFLVILGALFGANLAVHLGWLGVLEQGLFRGHRVALDVFALAIALVGGRVIPMFTRNATGRAEIVSKPWADRACLVLLAALAAGDALGADVHTTGVLSLGAGVTGGIRALRWGTRFTRRLPLLWVLHAGYWLLVLGLVLRGFSALLGGIPTGTWTHALTAGAIGVTTLAMMARVTLGHTGRLLAPSRLTTTSFWLVLWGAVARVLAPFLPASPGSLVLLLSGVVWTLGFAGYFVSHLGCWLAPRVDGRPG